MAPSAQQWFQKPENALKRASELVSIYNPDEGMVKRQKKVALEILHDTLTSKRNKTWTPVHESMIRLYLDISIDLRLNRIAKDGLHQYRNLTLSQNVQSLEKVLMHFIDASEAKASEAKIASGADLSMEATDLEEIESPEAMLLSTTTSENSRDRTAHTHVVPWLRFLWEAYRTVLDILKFNSQLEGLYVRLANRAFTFCLKYKRKIEFRRLCEVLRMHLGTIEKHLMAPTAQSMKQMRTWEGWSPESVERHLTLRYEQLRVSTTLEHWTEAFRTIEDIHAVIHILPNTKNQLVAYYYEQLTTIFWVSRNYIFHAHAWLKFYTLSRDQKTTITTSELSHMASSVMLATLSIPLDAKHTTGDPSTVSAQSSEKTQRLASLMGFSVAPNRSELLASLHFGSVVLAPEVAALHRLLSDQSFEPLTLTAKVVPLLVILRAHATWCVYVPSLERLLIQRVISQLSVVYEVVTLDSVHALLAGLSPSKTEMERLWVKDIAAGHFQARVNHKEALVTFTPAATGAALDDSRVLTTQLSTLGKALQQLSHTHGFAPFVPTMTQGALPDASTLKISAVQAALPATHTLYLARKTLIEKRKEAKELLRQDLDAKRLARKQLLEKARKRSEQARLAEEATRRDYDKRQRIKDEIQLKETQQMFERLGRDTSELSVETFKSVDKEAILAEAAANAAAAKEEASRKLSDAAKRLDYIIRATREEELPILQGHYAKSVAAAEAKAVTDYQALQVSSKLAYEAKVADATRLSTWAALSLTTDFETEFVTAARTRFMTQQAEAQASQRAAKQAAKLDRASERFADYQEQQEIAAKKAAEVAATKLSAETAAAAAERSAALKAQAMADQAAALAKQQAASDEATAVGLRRDTASESRPMRQDSSSTLTPSTSGRYEPVRRDESSRPFSSVASRDTSEDSSSTWRSPSSSRSNGVSSYSRDQDRDSTSFSSCGISGSSSGFGGAANDRWSRDGPRSSSGTDDHRSFGDSSFRASRGLGRDQEGHSAATDARRPGYGGGRNFGFESRDNSSQSSISRDEGGRRSSGTESRAGGSSQGTFGSSGFGARTSQRQGDRPNDPPTTTPFTMREGGDPRASSSRFGNGSASTDRPRSRSPPRQAPEGRWR